MTRRQFPLLQQQHQHQQVFSMQQQQHLLPQTHISHRMGMSSSGGANLAPVDQQPVVSSSSATDFGALANRSSQLKPNSYLVNNNNNNNNNINIWPALHPEASTDSTKPLQPIQSTPTAASTDHLVLQEHLRNNAAILSGVGINDSSGHLSAPAYQQAQSVSPVNFLVASDVSITLPDFNGGWQSNADLPDRRDMIVKIVKIIEKIGPDANKMAIRNLT
jgi:hypothetical protein